KLGRSALLIQATARRSAVAHEIAALKPQIEEFKRLNVDMEQLAQVLEGTDPPKEEAQVGTDLRLSANSLIDAASSLQKYSHRAIAPSDHLALISIARRLSQAQANYRKTLDRMVRQLENSARIRIQWIRRGERGQAVLALALIVSIGLWI